MDLEAAHKGLEHIPRALMGRCANGECDIPTRSFNVIIPSDDIFVFVKVRICDRVENGDRSNELPFGCAYWLYLP